MKTTDLHQLCIEILEAKQSFERRKELHQQSIDGFPGTFPELRRKYKHEIAICDMCIARMNERHEKALNQILLQTAWK